MTMQFRRLLVVDDEEPITAAMGDYFASLGYVVDRAASEAEAISLIERRAYAAAVTDLRLSGSWRMDGLNVITHLRKRQPRAVCLVLTAHGDPALERSARTRGADDVLEKPTPLHLIADNLTQLLNARAAKSPAVDRSCDPS